MIQYDYVVYTYILLQKSWSTVWYICYLLVVNRNTKQKWSTWKHLLSIANQLAIVEEEKIKLALV